MDNYELYTVSMKLFSTLLNMITPNIKTMAVIPELIIKLEGSKLPDPK